MADSKKRSTLERSPSPASKKKPVSRTSFAIPPKEPPTNGGARITLEAAMTEVGKDKLGDRMNLLLGNAGPNRKSGRSAKSKSASMGASRTVRTGSLALDKAERTKFPPKPEDPSFKRSTTFTLGQSIQLKVDIKKQQLVLRFLETLSVKEFMEVVFRKLEKTTKRLDKWVVYFPKSGIFLKTTRRINQYLLQDEDTLEFTTKKDTKSSYVTVELSQADVEIVEFWQTTTAFGLIQQMTKKDLKNWSEFAIFLKDGKQLQPDDKICEVFQKKEEHPTLEYKRSLLFPPVSKKEEESSSTEPSDKSGSDQGKLAKTESSDRIEVSADEDPDVDKKKQAKKGPIMHKKMSERRLRKKAKKNKDENRKSEKDEKKKNRQARHQKKRSISAIESSTLEESIPLNPKIFQQLCTYIEHRGLGIEGLFRISGESEMVKHLYKQCNKEPGPDLSEIKDTHSVTGALKLWLRSLSDPLIPFTLYNSFITAARGDITTIKKCVSELPELHRNILAVLVKLLVKVNNNSTVNKMDAYNLGIIFGPTILWDKQLGFSFETTSIQRELVTQLIENFDTIFEGISVGQESKSPLVKKREKVPRAKPRKGSQPKENKTATQTDGLTEIKTTGLKPTAKDEEKSEEDNEAAFVEILGTLEVAENPEKIMAAESFIDLFASDEKFVTHLQNVDQKRIVQMLNSVCQALVDTAEQLKKTKQ